MDKVHAGGQIGYANYVTTLYPADMKMKTLGIVMRSQHNWKPHSRDRKIGLLEKNSFYLTLAFCIIRLGFGTGINRMMERIYLLLQLACSPNPYTDSDEVTI